MITVKFSLEYKCYPIWMYDEEGLLIDNDLPAELIDNKELDESLLEIQKLFDSQYLDNKTTFEYVGFKTDGEKADFIKKVNVVIDKFASYLGDNYVFVVDKAY